MAWHGGRPEKRALEDRDFINPRGPHLPSARKISLRGAGGGNQLSFTIPGLASGGLIKGAWVWVIRRFSN